MKRLLLLLVIALFCVVLVTHPHAQAEEADPQSQRSEAVERTRGLPRSSDVTLSPETIVESDPFGYLGGRSAVTPTGDFTWSLPLWAPPGRNGVEPSLSVEYSARGGNGLLGVGFSLG
jgi:hypothetical protein